MKIEFKNKNTVLILVLIIALLIAYAVWSTVKHVQHNALIRSQNTELANLRSISTIDSNTVLKELKKDTIMLPGDSIPYPVYHTQYVDRPTVDRATMKKIAVSDSTVRNLVAALDLKAREINRVTTLYTTTRAENLQLKKDVVTKQIVYRDKYVNIDIDSNLIAKNITFKGDVTLGDYYKKRNFFSPKEYYTSTLTDSPYLKLDSLAKVGRKQKETVFSMYVDNRISLPFSYTNSNTSFGSPTFSSTLNAEVNNSGTFAGYLGAGVSTNNYEKLGFIIVAGVKINLWRIKR